jgi:hypothetical protein
MLAARGYKLLSKLILRGARRLGIGFERAVVVKLAV